MSVSRVAVDVARALFVLADERGPQHGNIRVLAHRVRGIAVRLDNELREGIANTYDEADPSDDGTGDDGRNEEEGDDDPQNEVEYEGEAGTPSPPTKRRRLD